MKLTFDVKRHYGNVWYYPTNGDASFLCKLLERKALKHEQIEEMEKHGWDVTTNEFVKY